MRDKGHLDDREIQSDLYAAYRSSVRDNSGALISQDRFATAIQDRGVTPDPGRVRSIESGVEAEFVRFRRRIRFKDSIEANTGIFGE